MAKTKIWFLETRPNFLLLSVALVFLGVCVGRFYGFFHVYDAILSFIGLLLLHISTNVLNDYYDYKSGVDLQTKRTPFSGGSGILPAGLLRPGHVLRFAIVCFFVAVPIGIYFVLTKGWLLLPLLAVGAVCVFLYTPVLTRMVWPEFWAGLGLGTLPVLGTFFVQSGSYTVPALIASVPSGILVHNLLLLNEFPDVAADKTASKKTLPITLGNAAAAKFYSACTVLVYVWIAAAVAVKVMPIAALLALLTLPFAIKAIRGALNTKNEAGLVPALAANVMVVLLTQVLLGVGYLIGV